MTAVPGPTTNAAPAVLLGRRLTPATFLVLAVCAAVFLTYWLQAVRWDPYLARSLGLRDQYAIWSGEYWALLWLPFLHLGFAHFVFYAIWMWRIGRRVERGVGSLQVLAMVLLSAVVTTALELVASGTYTHGLSGVVFTLAAFQWVARRAIPAFDSTAAQWDAALVALWGLVCLGLEFTRPMPWGEIASGAHVGGAAFGVLWGWAQFDAPRPRRAAAALSIFLLLPGSVIAGLRPSWQLNYQAAQASQLLDHGRVDDALVLYDEIGERWPDDPWAHIGRARTYYQRKEFALALESAEAFLKERPKDARGWTMKGAACFELGRFADAEYAYDQAVRRSWNAWSLSGLATVLAHGDDGHRRALALEWARRAVETHPEDPQAHGALATALAANGRRDEADAAQERAAELSGDPEQRVYWQGAIARFDEIQSRRRSD